jgi:Uncharacterized protein conserved in bacteria
MTDHLRFSGATEQVQREALEAIIRAEPTLMRVLATTRELALPDAWLVSGAIYNCVWNSLTGRPALHGVNDIDIIYFDPDLSWDAEDRVIKAVERALDRLPIPVQPRNQARVHLWFEQKFGFPFAPLASSRESLLRYASKTHAVAARLEADGGLTIDAPFGLEDMFAFRVTPNPAADNRLTHEKKGARIRSIWPEVTVVPW